jgi:hypothetical protein
LLIIVYQDKQSRGSLDTGGSEGRPYSGLEMVIKGVTDKYELVPGDNVAKITSKGY